MPNRPSKIVSQQKIASDLGFSQSLVSKVLNGRHAGIPDTTVRQIWDYARECGYRPRGANLDMLVADTVATPMVGFILRSPLRLANENHVYNHAQQGMHEFLASRNVRSVFLGSEADLDPAAVSEHVGRHRLMLGIVVMGEVKPSFMAELAKCGKPIALLWARYPEFAHSVFSNLDQAGELLVDHLYNAGHRSFGWIGSSHSANSHARHRNALEKALAARGLSVDPECEFIADEASRHNGNLGAGVILDRNRRTPPTAIVCFSAMMARGAINRLFQEGFSVPRDCSVAAFDMTQVCVEENPQITSASASPEALGATAAQLVFKGAFHPSPGFTEVTLPATLAVRDTTGPAPTRTRRPRRQLV